MREKIDLDIKTKETSLMRQTDVLWTLGVPYIRDQVCLRLLNLEFRYCLSTLPLLLAVNQGFYVLEKF